MFDERDPALAVAIDLRKKCRGIGLRDVHRQPTKFARAYRCEIKSYGRTWRRLGLALLLTGVAVVLVRGRGFDLLSLALLLAGWVLLIPVIVARSRYRRRRMAEGDPD